MKHELQGLLRSGHPTRTDEWHDPEPIAEDDPEVARGPVGWPGPPTASLATVRLEQDWLAGVHRANLELARFLSRSAFPASPRELIGALRHAYAPDALVESLERLPRTARYANVQELAEALTGAGRPTRRRNA